MSRNKIINQAELVKNNGENDNKLWVLIDGKVYDMTEFNHPGGKEILMEDQENDRFDEFESIHSPAAKRQMEKYLIGTIEGFEDKKTEAPQDWLIKEKATKQASNNFVLIGIVFLLIAVAVVYLKVLKK